ncbi:DNA-processing protein DprA [soil metagenome]
MTGTDARALERTAWIALASTSGIGDAWFERLLSAYGSASGALEAVARLPHAQADRLLARQLGMPSSPGLAERLRESLGDPQRTERLVSALGGWTLTPLDAAYPARLGELEHPPPVLYGIGRQEVLEGRAPVAVVGTRRPTGSGRHLAACVAARLAQVGATVVSGLAVGVDGAAHAATVEEGGITLGVAGSGLRSPAPRLNRRLVRAIIEARGAIVSELAPEVRPTPGTFPRRNRIISVLAIATIVIEAPARSGALITARLALEQGRRVLAAPGRPLDPSVAGCLALLRETPARVLVGLDEMVDDLGLIWPARPAAEHMEVARPSTTAALASLSDVERDVATRLMAGPQTIDGLVARTGRPPGEVVAAVTLLQLRGWAKGHGSVMLAAGALVSASATRQPAA